jgi:SPP1 family predicted phage head-tail adaptor
MVCKNPVAQMNRRVTIQAITQTTDGQGGFTESWDDVASVWASIDPMSDYEKFQAQQLQTNTTHKLKMRYYPGLTTKHRLLFGDRIFNIKGITNPGEENRFLDLRCIETT